MTTIPSQPTGDLSPTKLQTALQRLFGYTTFRPPQEEIIQCLLQRQDAIAIMPTGGGKSICFQLPALMQPGLTLVLSPLVALMENQVQELRQQHRSVALLHSELSRSQHRQTLNALEQQKLRLLYLSPETLLSDAVWQRLTQPDLRINGIVLDEAHCLVQWGETFRPTYFRLGAVRSALLQTRPVGTRIPIAAFTATADPQAQQTIQRILQLEHPRIFRLNPYRNNLTLQVQVCWTPRQRKHQLLSFIQHHNGQAGLVYVRTRRDSEDLATWFTQQGFQTAAYHAGLSPEERRGIEQSWLNGPLQFVVCTNAFGMGINKPDVRWIAHFHVPTLLSEYVQEIGRAGRDGKPAVALSLISETTGWLDPADKQRRRFFEAQMQQQQRTAQHLIHKLPDQGEVTFLVRQNRENAVALSLLHSTGCLEWTDPFHYRITGKAGISRMGQSNTTAGKQMTRYLKTRECRWRFLLQAFGFESDGQHHSCGHCDNCCRRGT